MDIYNEIRKMFLLEKMSERRIAKELHISREAVPNFV